MSLKSYAIGFVILFSLNILCSQPSGGPYGPIQKSYDLPNVSGTIYYVSPNGNKSSEGTSLNNPTTLETAIAKVKTNDAIVLRGGTYRTGNLKLNQSILMQPYQNEKPVIKGTYVAANWEFLTPPINYKNGLWKIKWTHLFPSKPDDWWRTERSGRHTPLHKFNDDMVFVDGKFLQSVGWLNELTEDTFYIDYKNGYVYIATDPTDKLVEITAFNQGLVITPDEVNGKQTDGKGPTIKGLTFTQYAFHVIDVEGYYPEGISKENEHGKDVVGTTFEDCTISYGGRVGAFLLGDKLTMRNCLVSDTSTEGVYIVASSDVLLEKNIFTRNNIENIRGYFPSAVKIFNQTRRVTCNDNLVIDHPNSNGIWYDVGNEDGVFTNNWLENVGDGEYEFTGTHVWPSRNAFFFEISRRCIVSGNVFVNNDQGILVLNASDVKVYNNTFVNSRATFGRDRRGENTDHFGWHITTGPKVDQRVNNEFANNLLVSSDDYQNPLLYVWQFPDLCNQLKEPSLSKLDNNTYVKLNNNQSPVVWYGQKLNNECLSKFQTSDDVHTANSKFASNSKTLIDYNGPFFKSIQLKNFELIDGFEKTPAMELPSEVKKAVGSKNYIGAYSN